MAVKQIVFTSNETGANARPVPHSGGPHYFSVEGDFDTATVMLVLAQTDPANFEQANSTQLTSAGGFEINLPDKHILGIDVADGGVSLNITCALDPIRTFNQPVSRPSS